MNKVEVTRIDPLSHIVSEIDQAKYQRQHRINNPVIAIRETIEAQVREFESSLEDDYELGARLASFGSQILIIVESIQFSEPNMVIFHGRDEKGNKLQLLQHSSQLNLLLNAVKKINDEPRRPIGFQSN